MIAVFDLDGTLTIPGDRLKYIKQEKRDWDTFYDRCGEDECNLDITTICHAMHRHGYTIWFVTGRPERVRDITNDWLYRKGLAFANSRLFMRPDRDFRPDTVVKPELVKEHLHNIDVVFEDRASMVAAWRARDITCLQVTEGNY